MTDDKKSIGRIALRRELSPATRAPVEEPSRRSAERPSDASELKTLSQEFGVPAIDLRKVCLKLADLDILPREIALEHVILPVLVRDDRLFVAMANPGDQKVIDELEFVTDKRVYPYVAVRSLLATTIE